MELFKRLSSWLQFNYVDGSECNLSLSLILSLSQDEFRPPPFKRVLFDFQDMNGRGRSSDETAFQLPQTRPQNSMPVSMQKTDGVCAQDQEQSCWATMQPELLRFIMLKVDECRGTWPSRMDVFACASVCKSWREAMKDAVKGPELSGRLTFPISVKQPGPRKSLMQCFVKRDRINSTFYLYISSTTESGKFLLAARRFKKATSCHYIISLDASNMSQEGRTYVGKLRSNFLGSKFTIEECLSSEPAMADCPGKGMHPNQSLSGTSNGGHISYELELLGARQPRRMQCILNSAPVSYTEKDGVSYAEDDGVAHSNKDSSISLLRSKSTPSSDAAKCEPVVNDTSGKSAPLLLSELVVDDTRRERAPLKLKNKPPRWHEHMQCWCLNFRGRVTIASVKNFQLVGITDATEDISHVDYDRVLLQFGKVGKDMFNLDYKYPLSAFQAFAICLSCFGTKGAMDGSMC